MKSAFERVRGAEVFTTLSRNGSPGDRTGSVIHHGARAFLALLLAVFATLLFPPAEGIEVAGYRAGDVASDDVIAQFSFDVPLSPEELEVARSGAAGSVNPTYRLDAGAARRMTGALEDLFQRIGGVTQGEDPDSDEARVRALLETEDLELTDGQVRILADSVRRALLLQTALGTVEEMLPSGVVDGFAAQTVQNNRIRVRVGIDSTALVEVDDVATASDLYSAAGRRLPATIATVDAETALRQLLVRMLVPSLVLDEETTEREKDDARRAVSSTKYRIVTGEAIVRANQQIGDTELERLRAYREAQRNRGITTGSGWTVSTVLGAGLRALLVILVYGLVLFQFRREIYNNFRWVLVHAVLIAVFVLVAAVVGSRAWPVEYLPVAFATLSVGLLWDGRIALVMAMLLTILTATLPAFDLVTAVPIVFAGGAAAALTVRAVRRRSQTWIFIAVIASGYALMLLALTLLGERSWGAFIGSLPWAALSAALSAILAMGVLPVLEWFTGITTDQTLLEWADPNRPLLGRVSREAPGTYAHTIGVANLAEAAANAIGAHGLLCRVGTYYHDVGKVVRPGYFIENQPGGRNPHARISPATSAAIIREHVTEGLRLAREHAVPEVIRQFIAEHHGTQRIGFFYEKAIEEAGDGDPPDPATFTYPGPRPRSRETAILMLADSLESATRALQDPTPERIRDLVDSIVASKIDDGQLDDCPITQRELAILKDEFTKMLAGMYHTRIDYPQTRHLTAAPTNPPKRNAS